MRNFVYISGENFVYIIFGGKFCFMTKFCTEIQYKILYIQIYAIVRVASYATNNFATEIVHKSDFTIAVVASSLGILTYVYIIFCRFFCTKSGVKNLKNDI